MILWVLLVLRLMCSGPRAAARLAILVGALAVTSYVLGVRVEMALRARAASTPAADHPIRSES